MSQLQTLRCNTCTYRQLIPMGIISFMARTPFNVVAETSSVYTVPSNEHISHITQKNILESLQEGVSFEVSE